MPPNAKPQNISASNAFLGSSISYIPNLKEWNSDKDLSVEFTKITENGYIPLFVSDNVCDSKEAQYRCVVFMHPKDKKILLANAGTRIGKFGAKAAVADIYDDARLGLSMIPKKFSSAQQVNEHVLELLKDYPEGYDPENPELKLPKAVDISEWQFEYTGHSLGAAMARIQALDMHMKLLDRGITPGILPSENQEEKHNISVTLFDAPSYAGLLEKIVQQHNKQKGTNYELRNIVKADKVQVFQGRSNLVNAVGESEMLKLNQSVYEVFQLDKKESLFNKFMHSRVGEAAWSLVRRTCSNIVKAKLTGVAVGGIIGAFLPFPGGTLVGCCVGAFVQEAIQDLMRSHRFKATCNKLANLPRSLSDTKSHSLRNFTGAGGQDSKTACVELKPFDAIGVESSLSSSYGIRMIAPNKEILDELLKLEAKNIDGVHTFSTVDIKPSLELGSICKYFIEKGDGKLVGCSRMLLLQALRNIRDNAKDLKEQTQSTISTTEEKTSPIILQRKIETVISVSEGLPTQTSETFAKKLSSTTTHSKLDPELPKQIVTPPNFDTAISKFENYRKEIDKPNSENLQQAYEETKKAIDSISKPISTEARVQPALESLNGTKVPTLDPTKIIISNLPDNSNFIISRKFGDNLSIIAKYEVQEGKVVCSDIILPAAKDCNLKLVDKNGDDVLEQYKAQNPTMSAQKLIENYLKKNPGNAVKLKIQAHNIKTQQKTNLCSAAEFINITQKIQVDKSFSQKILDKKIENITIRK